MNTLSSSELTEKIIEKAKSLGASIAGVASVESLKESPSHRIYPKIGMNLEGHLPNAKNDVKADEVAWPADAVSAVVIGVAHHADEPELDWWDGKGTPGNRIRFRALLLDQEAEATDPREFNPCEDCEQPCREACPIKAFQHTVYSADALSQSILSGINGTYDRVTCNRKMGKDIEEAVMVIPASDEEHQDIQLRIREFEEGVMVTPKGDKAPYYCVKYCRECELNCPVGKSVMG